MNKFDMNWQRKPAQGQGLWWWLGWLALLGAGCQPPAPEPAPVVATPPTTPQELRLVAVDDTAELATQLARLWTAETGGALEVIRCTHNELAAGTVAAAPTDLWLYPNLQLGDMLAAGRLQMLDRHWIPGTEPDRAALLPLERGVVVQAGTSTAGVSLGSPLLVVMYRQDVWEALDLPLPETWIAYRLAAEKIVASRAQLQQREPPLPTEIYEPWEGPWVAELFFARAATQFGKQGRLSSFFDIATMDPLVSTPPFVAAAEEMTALHPLLSDVDSTPFDCYQRMLQGKGAMAIAFVTSQPPLETAVASLPLAIRELPRAERLYDYRSSTWVAATGEERVVFVPTAGRLVSLAADCRRIRTAMRFLDWLNRPETNLQVGRFVSDAGPVTATAMEPPYPWIAEPLPRSIAETWAQIVRDANDRALPVGNLRIAHRPDFLAPLQRELRSIVTGGQAAETGLARVATEWNELLNRLGRQSLLQQYRATAGVE